MVGIVTVSHDSFHCLERLQRSLKDHTSRSAYEWVIVDNGSRRLETNDLLFDLAVNGDATVIKNAENLWFTRATNQGIAASTADIIMLLNPDIEVTPGWLEAMLKIVERPGVGIVGAVLVNEQGMVVHGGARDEGAHDGYGERYRPDAIWALEREHDGWVSGACLMIPRAVLNAVGGKLDERHKHYFSDMVLGNAVRSAGYAIWISAHVLVHSMGGANW